MDDPDSTILPQPGSGTSRPLLGLTVLAVEDSTYTAEALRLMCLRSGARIRRADSLTSARKHLRLYRPTVLIADLGLPDGSGAELIEEQSGAFPRVGVILGLSGDSFGEEMAIAAGADGFLDKPVSSLARFQTEILRRLPADLNPACGALPEEEIIHPDPLAYRDDMAHAADILTEDDSGAMLGYVAQFLRGVARSADDGALVEAADRLARARTLGTPLTSPAAQVAGLVQQRLREARAL